MIDSTGGYPPGGARMSETQRISFIPSGSLGLKMLLVCGLVLLMFVPLLFVEAIVRERQARANSVTQDLSVQAGGQQTLGGPMLLVPYERRESYNDAQGVARERTVRGSYIVFADTGSANATLTLKERRRGIYRAASYDADTVLSATFRPGDALRGAPPGLNFDWTGVRVVMFVSDARAVRSAAELTYSDGTKATLEPMADLSVSRPAGQYETATMDPRVDPGIAYVAGLQAFAAPTEFTAQPEEFKVDTRFTIGGAQRFAVNAFAQDTSVTISGDRRDASAIGHFQTADGVQFNDAGFTATWRVPFIARALPKADDLAALSFTNLAAADMAISFVASDDVYQGVTRAVRYAIMFIGIVFLATLIFEALSGKKAHPAQYVLVGLAQSVFYLLLLALTEVIGFTTAFMIAGGATVVLLAYYAGASAGSLRVGLAALVGLSALYGVMYTLMTIEDFAFFAGAVIAFLVIAGAMISTSRINWYGRGQPAPATA
jgi:inner membrane protein